MQGYKGRKYGFCLKSCNSFVIEHNLVSIVFRLHIFLHAFHSGRVEIVISDPGSGNVCRLFHLEKNLFPAIECREGSHVIK